jgi:PhnB protein
MGSPREEAVKVEPYLFFNGRADEAIQFYQDTLGARVEMLLRFKESPEPPPPGVDAAELADKVMHASLIVGETRIMASDGCGTGTTSFAGVSLSVQVPTATEAERLFAALGEGGSVQMPLTPTFFSAGFGMVADRFGVNWMVVADPLG